MEDDGCCSGVSLSSFLGMFPKMMTSKMMFLGFLFVSCYFPQRVLISDLSPILGLEAPLFTEFWSDTKEHTWSLAPVFTSVSHGTTVTWVPEHFTSWPEVRPAWPELGSP